MRAILLALALAACTQGEAPSSEADGGAEAPDQPQADAAATQTQQPITAQDALARMPSWEGARAAGVDFRAVGQEPGWILDIYTERRMRLVWDYGESAADFPLTPPTYPQEGATRYEAAQNGRTLAVTIRRAPCQDAMSGAPYPSTVEVVIDGRTLNGCGKSV
ncbi:MAG TPA: hypothetical protein VEA80_03585 [Vitreimonas sp.]|uniref:COG3650 family protein n=1 Tax=Vitreimonas sp. TaxID=3069702 RepID=UPI002D5733FE|nr:hypothetical protein [Vitreimonas sp.]HYD86531.1 hypothetical protein [Vitreimonas sp.]